MLTLRPYQQLAVDQIRGAFKQGTTSLILCAPTGSGKTVTFSYIAKHAVSRGKRVMIVVNRKELLNQSVDKLNKYGLFPTVIAPGHKQEYNLCYVASVDTLHRRTLPLIDLVIFDEAHIQTFDKIIDRYKKLGVMGLGIPYFIGATATPFRSGSQRGLDECYDAIIEPVKIQELIDDRHLVKARYFGAQRDFSRLKKKGGDFDNHALMHVFGSPEMYDGVVKQHKRFSQDGPTICFNVNQDHSEATTEKFKSEGFTSASVTSRTSSKDRVRIFRDFEAGLIDVLNNCGIATTGYDNPGIRNTIINRATTSLPLHLQMPGRGSRPDVGKEAFHVIDMGSNIFRLGRWHENREWSLEKKRKQKSDGVAPIKECVSCGSLIHSSKALCEFCGMIQPKNEKKLLVSEFTEVKEMANRKVTGKMNMRELHAYAKEKGYKSGWVHHQFKNRR